MRGDRRPEAFAAGEVETQLRFLDYLRESVARKLEGLSEEEVRADGRDPSRRPSRTLDAGRRLLLVPYTR
jgi:hypothetical protein